MITIHNADHVDLNWQMRAETALVAGLTYVGAVTAAAMAAAAGDSLSVVGTAAVCTGAVRALVGMAFAALARSLYDTVKPNFRGHNIRWRCQADANLSLVDDSVENRLTKRLA